MRVHLQMPSKFMKMNLIILFLLGISLTMTGERSEWDKRLELVPNGISTNRQLELQRVKSQQALDKLTKTILEDYELSPKSKK